ncbi:hypothetical protein CH92_01485 [Stutzerimonas stutzeri]|uniref:T6SS Phospholipase effector Tle1-like catalytic domain-containing protein n=1 Tax=Stutzerimonas stutzeri TaxID=316 RepID=W8RP89_STUST|nr:DUF2235 domain-containing protein [Stutzerimonas stutzeri]AHL73836.1 hypothetical protein CH92_01485 [Stutzerimonas stutzeri]MCQ4328646.1 DUF2235 domain-containing protein [Stutzerimonas stutzeri]
MSGYVPNIPRAKRDAELKDVQPVDIHAERWTEYERHSSQPAKSPEKIQLALRIGVFFDGTLNNATNAALGLACGAHHPIAAEDLNSNCKPYMAEPDSSYGNDVTNVRKLMDLYWATSTLEGEAPNKRGYRKLYVDGAGTEAGNQDSDLGAAAGRGGTGVAGQVQDAFNRISELIQSTHQDYPDHEICSLTFDTFGFSRGAAAARHFANEVVKGKQGFLGAALQSNVRVFNKDFVDHYGRDINISFIGLFDTVASVGGLKNLGNIRSSITPWLNLYLSRKYFANVVQLVARDEIRANFPLSEVSPDHPEIILPGVHSDIGGGYLDDAEERVMVSPMQALVVAQRIDVTTTSIYQDAAEARQRMIAEGWPPAMLEIVTPEAQLLPVDPRDRLAPRQKRVYAGLQLKRRVSNALSIVYFRVMYELARRNGVRFEDIPDELHYLLPGDLTDLCSRFIQGNYSLNYDEEALLKRRYIHASAHWNNPQGKRTPSGLKVLYINAPNEGGVRNRHPHAPNWTLF